VKVKPANNCLLNYLLAKWLLDLGGDPLDTWSGINVVVNGTFRSPM